MEYEVTYKTESGEIKSFTFEGTSTEAHAEMMSRSDYFETSSIILL